MSAINQPSQEEVKEEVEEVPEQNELVSQEKEKTSEQKEVRSPREVRKENRNKDDDWKSRFEGYRSSADKRDSERVREIQALNERLAKYSKLDPYVDRLAQYSEAEKRQQLTELMKTDPMAAQRLMAEEAKKQVLQELAPVQQQYQQIQEKEFNGQVVNYLQQTSRQIFGNDEAFKTLEPHMAQVLNEVKQTDIEGFNKLRQNPGILLDVAIGRAYRAKGAQDSQARQQVQTTQSKVEKFASSSLKNNKSSKNAPVDQSNDLIRKNYEAYLNKNGL